MTNRAEESPLESPGTAVPGYQIPRDRCPWAFGRFLSTHKRLHPSSASLRLALLVLLLSAHAAVAQEPPRFVARTIDGPLPAARIVGFGDDGVLHLDSGVKIALADFVELRQTGRKVPAPPAPPFVVMTTGDRFPIDPAHGLKVVDGRLHAKLSRPLQSAKEKPANLFLPHVAQVFWMSPEGDDDAAPVQTSRKQDVVFLRGGDRLEGRLTSLDPAKGATIVDDKRTLTPAWEQFAGVAFSLERQAKVRAKKAHLLAVTSDGARVHFAQLRLDAKQKTWAGKTLFGLPLELPLEGVVSLQSIGGRAVPLSELVAARQEQTPYLGVVWPTRLDASASGRPMRLAGDWHDRGVGMHTQSLAAYKLDGKFAWFEAAVGMDDAGSPRSRAKAALLIDGKRHDLNAGKEMRVGDPTIDVRLDVRGAKELVLVVEFGSFGDVRADVDWGSARLLKAE